MLIDLVKAKVRDSSGRLEDPDDYEAGIAAALAALSRFRPVLVAQDLPGAGSRDVSLPAGWEAEFSQVRRVEYPVGQFPEAYLDPESYAIYPAPSGPVLRLRDDQPAATEDVRVWWTRSRLEADVSALDADAVANLAASVCLRQLAASYGDATDPTLQADAVNYRSKIDEYRRLADALENQFRTHFGVREGEAAPAAAATASPPRRASWGRRLTH